MRSSSTLVCDGCGQAASPGHIAARLRRLEWATRFRPVHIRVLFVGAAAPAEEADFLYAVAGVGAGSGCGGSFSGEGRELLAAAGLLSQAETKGRAEILSLFQHCGYFLTHVLECPLDRNNEDTRTLEEACARRLPEALARIRRSLKPQRIALISQSLDALIPQFAGGAPGAALVLNGGRAFALGGAATAGETEKLGRALAFGAESGQ